MTQWILVPAISGFATLILTPLVRHVSMRFGWVDCPDGVRKLHHSPISRVGGIALFLAWVVSVLCATPWHDAGMQRFLQMTTRLAPAVLFIFAVGLYDDLFKLSARRKLTLQVAAGILAYGAGVRLDIVAGWHVPVPISFILTLFWLSGMSNAFNLIDGMDGLAPGLGTIAAVGMSSSGWVLGDPVLLLAGLILGASLFAFLAHNAPPASVFMGDCGSLSTGFLLGCCGIWWMREATSTTVLAPVFVLFIPLIDTVLSMCRRFLRGRSLFSADRGHLHHRLLDLGFSIPTALLVLYASGIAAAVLAVGITLGRWTYPTMFAVLASILLMGVRTLNYPEFAALGDALAPSGFRQRIRARIAARDLEESLATCPNPGVATSLLVRACQDLGVTASTGESTKHDSATDGSPDPSSVVLFWPAREGDPWLIEWKPGETSLASIAELVSIADRHVCGSVAGAQPATFGSAVRTHEKATGTGVSELAQIQRLTA